MRVWAWLGFCGCFSRAKAMLELRFRALVGWKGGPGRLDLEVVGVLPAESPHRSTI